MAIDIFKNISKNKKLLCNIYNSLIDGSCTACSLLVSRMLFAPEQQDPLAAVPSADELILGLLSLSFPSWNQQPWSHPEFQWSTQPCSQMPREWTCVTRVMFKCWMAHSCLSVQATFRHFIRALSRLSRNIQINKIFYITN